MVSWFVWDQIIGGCKRSASSLKPLAVFERKISHIRTEIRSKPRLRAAVGNTGQCAKA